MLKIGEINTLNVLRKTDIGYMLINDEKEEVFLHNNETNHRILADGEVVDAFLYLDAKGRLTGTLATPFLTINKMGFLRVKEVNYKIGVFLDNNIAKDILLSGEDLPNKISLWPVAGDYMYVYLKVKGKMVAKRVTKAEIEPPELPLVINETYQAFVYKIFLDGISLITETRHLVFVHKHNFRKEYRLGEEVTVKITNNNKESYNGTLIAPKEDQLYEDANHILAYLIKQGGIMDFDADSEPIILEKTFKLSKKSFKRGLGNLYKQRLIRFENGKTILIKRDDNNE